ncbi:MAG TPA: hypothetical protein VGD56_22655 [Gemmatirosa sp.]
MTRTSRAALLTLGIGAVAATPRAAAAQGGVVGYPPTQSPFADLEYNQAFTLLGGYFNAAKDPAGVAPRGGGLIGLQYDLGSGPAIFTTRVRTVFSDRTVLDPARPANDRVLGTEKRPLTMADAGLTLALTGSRTFHGLVPLVHIGAGLVTNFAGADPGGFDFGTSFALAYGLGLKYVPGPTSRYALRVDFGSTLYRVRYPASYARASTGYDTLYKGSVDSTSIVPSNAALSRYRNNTALTVGVSYLFHR